MTILLIIYLIGFLITGTFLYRRERGGWFFTHLDDSMTIIFMGLFWPFLAVLLSLAWIFRYINLLIDITLEKWSDKTEN